MTPTSTISRFGERFRDGQYSLVSFLFAVFLLDGTAPCQAICKSGSTCSRVPYGVGAGDSKLHLKHLPQWRCLPRNHKTENMKSSRPCLMPLKRQGGLGPIQWGGGAHHCTTVNLPISHSLPISPPFLFSLSSPFPNSFCPFLFSQL